MKIKIIKLLLLLILTNCLFSCKKEPEIIIEKEQFRTVTASIDGDASATLTDVWIDPAIKLTFSKEINVSKLKITFEIKEISSGTAVPIVVNTNDNINYVLVLQRSLSPLKEHQIVITQEILTDASKKTSSFSFTTGDGVPKIDAQALQKKTRHFKLIDNNYPGATAKVVTSQVFASNKPSFALPFDVGYVDAQGNISVSTPQSAEQKAVFGNTQQAAVFYLAQSFLENHYNTKNLPLWVRNGFAAYEAKIRPSVEQVKGAINKLGRKPGIDEFNNAAFFISNEGLALSYTFFEWMSVYIGNTEMRWSFVVNSNGSLNLNINNAIKNIEDLNRCWHLFLDGCYLNTSNKLIRPYKETNNVIYYYSNFDSALFPEYSNKLEETLTRYLTLLDVQLAEKVTFFLMPDRIYHFEWSGIKFDPNSWSIGGGVGVSGFRMVSPNAASIYNPIYLMQHELAHTVQFQIKPNFMPAWLSEGFATFLPEGEISSSRIASMKAQVNDVMGKAVGFLGHKPNYEDICKYVNVVTEYDYYMFGMIMVDFVVKKYGYSGLKKIILSDGQNFSVVGLNSKDEFMAKFYEYYDSTWK